MQKPSHLPPLHTLLSGRFDLGLGGRQFQFQIWNLQGWTRVVYGGR